MSNILPTRLTGLPSDEVSFAHYGNERPCCCWKEGNLIRFSVYSGEGWTFLADRSRVVEGDNLSLFDQSLDIDSYGNPHIVYLDSGILRYSGWDGSSWSSELVYDTSQYEILSASLACRSDALYLFMATNDHVKTVIWLFKKPLLGVWALQSTMQAHVQDLDSIKSRLKVADQDLYAFWVVQYGLESWIGHAFYDLVTLTWRYRPLKRVNLSVTEGEITGLDFVAEDIDLSSSSSFSSLSSSSSLSTTSQSSSSLSSSSSSSLSTTSNSTTSVSSLSSLSTTSNSTTSVSSLSTTSNSTTSVSSLSTTSNSTTSVSSQSSSSYNCPNNIYSLTTDIVTDVPMISDKFVAVRVNDSITQDNYIKLFSGDVSGRSYDTTRIVWGDASNTGPKTSSRFVSVVINSSTYYIEIFSGDNTIDCCSNIQGTEETIGSFVAYGFALVMVNDTDLRYIKVFTKV